MKRCDASFPDISSLSQDMVFPLHRENGVEREGAANAVSHGAGLTISPIQFVRFKYLGHANASLEVLAEWIS